MKTSDNGNTSINKIKSWLSSSGIQFIKFGLVGALNTLLSYLIINGCYYLLGLHEQISNAINFVITVFISYLLNSKFVFAKKGDEEKQPWYKSLLKVYASYAITELLLMALLLFVEERIFHVPHYIATLINLVITVPANFLLNKYWAYRKKEKKDSSGKMDLFERLDQAKLWIAGFVLMSIVFIPYIVMGEKSVIPWFDQLDENMLNYVLTARHFGDGASIFPEMMCGVNASALQPFALLFLPLYLFLPIFPAFIIQYAVVFAMAFFGMYGCVKKVTRSSILALISAGLFSMLPFYPVYGAAVAGIPIALYAILSLQDHSEDKKTNLKNRIIAFLLLTLFATTAHLVFSGYAVITLWGLWIVIKYVRGIVYNCRNKKDIAEGALHKRKLLNIWEIAGTLYLVIVYIAVNYQLVAELLIKTEDFVSHRTEFEGYYGDFGKIFVDVFLHGSQHADSYHIFVIPIIALIIVFSLVFHRKLDAIQRKKLRWSIAILATLIGISLFYAFTKWEPFVVFKNANDGILHYFAIERFYWLSPCLWYLELAVCLSIWFGYKQTRGKEESRKEEADDYAMLESNAQASISKLPILCRKWFQTVVIVILLVPTILLIASKSYFYIMVNEMRNGNAVTGNITWEGFYSQDVMSQIDDAIGRDKDSFRVVQLGINPTPALVYGFHTVDGYSNNYPLEYKHAFREVMEDELAIDATIKDYYDRWGNRCYLFNSQTGTSYMNGKKMGVTYEGLVLDWTKLLRDFGCEYVFSCGEILDYESQGLSLVGYYESDTSYWGIWVYRILS